LIRRFGALPAAAAGALAVLVVPCSARADSPTKSECAAANETAQDLRSSGKLRDARRNLAVCTSDSCPGPIREDCAQRLQEVEGVMPTIVVGAVDPSGHDLSRVRVTMDGEALVQRLGGTAIEVDPGQHRFVFEAEGFKTRNESFLLREGERERNLRVVLEPLPIPSASGSDGSTMRTLGLGLGGAGAAGIVLGSILGLVAKGTYNHAIQDECSNDAVRCTEQGVRDGESAHSQAAFATAGFIVGTALLVAGAAFYFTAPHEGTVAVGGTVSPGGGGVALRGRW
jgi:hypothetical protein